MLSGFLIQNIELSTMFQGSKSSLSSGSENHRVHYFSWASHVVLLPLYKSVCTYRPLLHRFWGGSVVVGADGSTIVSDYLVENLNSNKPTNDVSGFNGITKSVEYSICEIKSRYVARMGRDFEIELLVGGLEEIDKGEPILKRMYQNGISENVTKFAIIGHGAPYATTLFGLMFDQMLTVKETALLWSFVISAVVSLEYDQTVGVDNLGPEVVVIKTDEKPEFMDTSTKDFERTKSVAKSLKFRNKLVTSIWEYVPQAYYWESGVD